MELGISGASFFLWVVDGFKAQMTELGHVEGKNIGYKVLGGIL